MAESCVRRVDDLWEELLKAWGRYVGRVNKGVGTICGQNHVSRIEDLWAESCKRCGGYVGRVMCRRVEDLSVGRVT